MSIQSTRFLTRQDAIERVRELRAKKLDVSQLSDEELESELDEMFYNYSIVEEGHPYLKERY